MFGVPRIGERAPVAKRSGISDAALKKRKNRLNKSAPEKLKENQRKVDVGMADWKEINDEIHEAPAPVRLDTWKQDSPIQQYFVIVAAISGMADNIQNEILIKSCAIRIQRYCIELMQLQPFLERNPHQWTNGNAETA